MLYLAECLITIPSLLPSLLRFKFALRVSGHEGGGAERYGQIKHPPHVLLLACLFLYVCFHHPCTVICTAPVRAAIHCIQC